jgi:hypothetical protein
MCAHSCARKVTGEWCDPGRHMSLIGVHRPCDGHAALRGIGPVDTPQERSLVQSRLGHANHHQCHH